MTERQIATLVRDRDEHAMNHAINKYSRLLWKIVQASLGRFACDEEIEECVADVFIHLWQNPDKYDEGRGTLKNYLCILARSKAHDKYRQLCRSITDSLDAAEYISGEDILNGIISREDAAQLNAAIDTLGEADREIILRRYYHRQKPAQIALAMDMSVKQVDNRLYRAKNRLRIILTEGGRYYGQE